MVSFYNETFPLGASLDFNEVFLNSSNLACAISDNYNKNTLIPKDNRTVSSEDIANKMHFRARNLGYGLGSILGKLINTISEKVEHTIAGIKNSFGTKSSKVIKDFKLEDFNEQSANLTTYFGDGHAMIKLECTKCSSNGDPVSRIYSFYPKIGLNSGSYCPDVSEDLKTIYYSFIGNDGIALSEGPFCLNEPQSYRYPITEQQARRVYEFVNAPHQYHFFGIRGYNCVDFAQKAFEEAGFDKHFYSDYQFIVRPGFWGTVPATYMWVYSKIYPINPIMTATTIVTSTVAIFLHRKIKNST
jgi:hypothetical protein